MLLEYLVGLLEVLFLIPKYLSSCFMKLHSSNFGTGAPVFFPILQNFRRNPASSSSGASKTEALREEAARIEEEWVGNLAEDEEDEDNAANLEDEEEDAANLEEDGGEERQHLVDAESHGPAVGSDDSNANEHLLRALARGRKPWGRSKIMIVGEGRAGKTALANSIIGRGFADTSSTVGINQVTCDVKFASLGGEGGGWSEYAKPSRELEAALARMIMDEQLGRGGRGEGAGDPSSHVSSGNAAPTIFVDDDEAGVVDSGVYSAPARVSSDDGTGVVVGEGEGRVSSESVSKGAAESSVGSRSPLSVETRDVFTDVRVGVGKEKKAGAVCVQCHPPVLPDSVWCVRASVQHGVAGDYG